MSSETECIAAARALALALGEQTFVVLAGIEVAAAEIELMSDDELLAALFA